MGFSMTSARRISIGRDSGELSSGSARRKHPDMQLFSVATPSNLDNCVAFLQVEEKPSNAAPTNRFTTGVPPEAYTSGQADRLKLARGLAATLHARKVTSAGQICFGVQWIGYEISIFAMTRQHANFYAFTELFHDSIENHPERVFWAILALRSLIQDQANLEFPSQRGAEPARVPLSSLPPTPSKDPKPKEMESKRGSSSTTRNQRRKGRGGTKDAIAHEAAFRGLEYDPLVPLPVSVEARWLPGSAGRYGDLQRVYAPLHGESTVWRGVRMGDQLPVALKRVAGDLWSSERELSMHLAATGVPGVVPLLDTFWDRPLGEGGKTSARVLVMPFLTCLAPRGHCIPLKHADVVLCLHNLLACLRKLHERRVVHMDIKPSNLFVIYADANDQAETRDRTISEFLLSDFGLSRVVGSQLHEPVGTRDFMPTEVALLGNDHEDDEAHCHHHDNYLEVSPKQDIYSLGRTIDWLLNQNPLGKQQERPIRMLTRKMQHAHVNQRPTVKEAQQLFQQLFQEFALHPDGPTNSP